MGGGIIQEKPRYHRLSEMEKKQRAEQQEQKRIDNIRKHQHYIKVGKKTLNEITMPQYDGLNKKGLIKQISVPLIVENLRDGGKETISSKIQDAVEDGELKLPRMANAYMIGAVMGTLHVRYFSRQPVGIDYDLDTVPIVFYRINK